MTMTQEEIIEGNKLIAIFMEFHVKNNGDGTYIISMAGKILIPLYRPLDVLSNPLEYFLCLFCNPKNTGHFKYYSSWDWLMPVVEKINLIKGIDIIIYRNTVHVNDEMEIIFETTGYIKDALWLAVVEFIKWYNQNTQP